MSILSDFIKESGLTSEAIVTASSSVERHSIDDRGRLVARENARRAKKSYADAGVPAEKPKALGRGISSGTLHRALGGAPTTRVVRKKILRAVNDRLANAKKDTVTSKQLFSDVPAKKGKSKAKK
ncbi:MAG: hypothetical protein HY791_00155 [Deltaproteobacteria bacterium]|nr:hypothetical protein [Deltaproteobacteria bacterium]